MRDMLIITGAGQVIRGTPTPTNRVGVFVQKDGLQGLGGLPVRRREALARALSHGEYDVPVRLPSRVITIDVHLIGRSEQEVEEIAERFRGWGATGDRFGLSVEQAAIVRTATVRAILAEASSTTVKRGRFFTKTGQAQLIAANPRLLGPARTVPDGGNATSIVAVNRGTFPAHVIVEIPAAPAGYTVTTPAGVFTVSGATAGGTHRIDTRTGRVTRDGVWMVGVGRGPLWAVPAADAWTHTLSAPGRVRIADTYI